MDRIFKRYHRLRINARITALVMAVFLPSWLYITYAILSSYQQDRETVITGLKAATASMRRSLEETIGGYETTLRVLSVSPHLNESDSNEFQAEAQAVLRVVPALNIVVLDPEGRQRLNTRAPPGSALPTEPPPFFARIPTARDSFLSDLFVGPVLKENLIALVNPVRSGHRLTNVIAMSLGTDTLSDILKRQDLPSTWIAGLFDSTGTIIARSHAPERFVGKKGVQAVLDSLHGPPEGLIETNILEGTRVILAYSRSERYGWSAVIAVPRDVLEANLKYKLWLSLITGSVILILTLGLARLLARGITAPIHALVTPALAIGKGEPVTVPPLNLREADEVGHALAAASELIHQRTLERDTARTGEREVSHQLGALRALNEILSQPAVVPAEQLKRALAMATAHLGLEYGFIGRLNGNTVTLLHHEGPNLADFTDSLTIPVEETYCSLTLESMGVVAVPDFANSPHAGRPFHRRFGFGAYIGAPIIIRGEVYGSLCFASPHALKQDFPPGDVEFIRMLSRWAAAVIDRERARRELVSAKEAAETAQHASAAQAEILAQSNADLEQFAYVASHDLRTPLRNVVSFAQLLERRYKGRLDPDADDFIRHIVENGRQMTVLITDLLEYSRVASQTRELQPVPAREAVNQALHLLEAAIAESGAQICVDDLPVVMGEPTHLISLFQNLLGNGIKYRSPARPPRLTVSAARSDGGFWCFSVADNGIGIDPQYFDKIFDIFQRLSPGTDKKGTGIGLTLCRRIVHRFGGAIWVESTPGDGATFHFTLRDGGAPDKALTTPA